MCLNITCRPHHTGLGLEKQCRDNVEGCASPFGRRKERRG